jgi:hypothetical protein
MVRARSVSEGTPSVVMLLDRCGKLFQIWQPQIMAKRLTDACQDVDYGTD